jgi:hypothetical protein
MLRKIIQESFMKEDKKKFFRMGDDKRVITEKLADYIRQTGSSQNPGCIFSYQYEIPSIPAGTLEIDEISQTVSVPSIEKIQARFWYLEGSPEEDLKQVRESITSAGLKPYTEDVSESGPQHQRIIT